MKRKMLISIALIMIMLLNCVMPLFVVNAAEGAEIQLNSNLFKAVKASLEAQGIEVEMNEVTHTFTLSEEEKASIKKLLLNEGAISDLTGLDAFSSLEVLELSGNNLTKDSNLGVLNNLPNLNYLDLSTNKLEDISEIRGLVDRLRDPAGSGKIILSGQNVMSVQSVYINTEEDSDNEEKAKFTLPTILELAGYIKSCWKNVRMVPQALTDLQKENGVIMNTPPFLSVDSIPMYVNDENYQIDVNIWSEEGKYGTPYYGMLEVTIYIHDDPTEAASVSNPNKAAENILNGSMFKLYFVTFDKSSEAITTMDTNLYNAIKEQLTAGQTKNPELSSYRYEVDTNGEIIYGEYYYTEIISGKNKGCRKLTEKGGAGRSYLYNPATDKIYKYVSDDAELKSENELNLKVEATNIYETDGSMKAGYRVSGSGDGKNLYIDAYDDARTFVIDDAVLTNKIPSLILNNKQIRDLSGLEYFVGLNSKLNVSHNYLEDINPLYNMEYQKENWEKQIVDDYTKWLKTREYGNLQQSVTEIENAEKTMKDNTKLINEAYDKIIETLKEMAKIQKEEGKDAEYAKSLEEKAKSIESIIDSIKGKTSEDNKFTPGYLSYINGYTDSEKGYIDGSLEKINKELDNVYDFLANLYEVYNDEYKLTSLLAPNVNYLTYDEYQTYEKTTKDSLTSAKGLLTEQINFIKTLEQQHALTQLDKDLISKIFNVTFTIDENKENGETPISKYFDEEFSKKALSRKQCVDYLNDFREIALYSEMANYCLIKRMNNETADDYCYNVEYLKNRIKNLKTEEIPTDLEERVLKLIEENMSDSYFDVYKNYEEQTRSYSLIQYGYIKEQVGKENYYNDKAGSLNVNTGKGEYKFLNRLATYRNETVNKDNLIESAKPKDNIPKTYTDVEGTTKNYMSDLLTKAGCSGNGDITSAVSDLDVPKQKTYEIIMSEGNDYKSTEEVELNKLDELPLYNQLMTLAKKLLNGDISKYVKLARLKDLNISYNADINIDRIAELQSLYTLDASYCYIADVSKVDWSSMPNLKRLYLGYNFISNMDALTKLPNIKVLDLSNNLLEGKLEITEQQFQSLFKNMEELNLSGNKISDVTSLLIYLDYISGGNYANYLAREDTLNIDLTNQDIQLVIEEPISLEDYPTTINVELPKIFTQLQKIDTERTSFGETSQRGRVEFEGSYVTLNTRTPGDKIAKVVVIAQTGDGSPVTTCVGEGTTATIRYTVVSNSDDDQDDDVDPTPDTNTNTDTPKPNTNTQKPDTNTNTDSPTLPDPSDEVVDTSDLGYEEGEEFVKGVLAQTPVSDFKTILLNGSDYEVVVTAEKDGEEVTSGYMKTGMYVKVLDDEGKPVQDQDGNLLVYQVVVKGDINGDGSADAADSVLIKKYRTEVINLEGAQFESADINNDKVVDVMDSKLLLYHRAEVQGFNLNYTK